MGFSPLIPAVQKEFALSFSQVGLFAGMYGLISIFVSVPAGLMIRTVGEEAALTGGPSGGGIGIGVAKSTSTVFGAIVFAFVYSGAGSHVTHETKEGTAPLSRPFGADWFGPWPSCLDCPGLQG